MTQNETYIAMAIVAAIAYSIGAKRAGAKAAAANSTYDPLGWLNGYTG